ncbi:type III secretion system stator protein SctL [Trinickia acidisoli]|uniref:type III secretion system stator protein SctL n=1 Tax=Trinickia acidisoli TaxID=2767482 RepID=UPI001A8F16FE|nr:type III secretion system stator protein SctL [Trinickia acidisoli]
MAIWLRNARCEDAVAPGASRVGACTDVLSVEDFATLVSLDECQQQLVSEREAILGAAHEEAERLIAAAHARASELVDAALRERSEAATQGYRHGEQEAIADWMERVAQAGDAHALMQTRMRERLASVVSVAVEKIVAVQQRELLFERALSEIDRIAGGAAYLRVSVHPSDHARAQSAFDRLAARWHDLGQPFPISVVADQRLEPGSCFAESDLGAIDASLETQLRAMRAAVSRALEHAARTSEQPAMADAACDAQGETDVAVSLNASVAPRAITHSNDGAWSAGV